MSNANNPASSFYYFLRLGLQIPPDEVENCSVMTTIVLKVKDKKQLNALMDVDQRFKIRFSGNMDETEYLLSTDENRRS